MLLKFADHARPDSLASRMRRQRMQLFARLVDSHPAPVRILDVGGTSEFWRDNPAQLRKPIQLTVLNLPPAEAVQSAGVEVLEGDARRMAQIPDASFHVCFSNSVIEHVGGEEDQLRMATEVRRVAQSYFIQTPYKYFPLEAHYHWPGWQFMPRELRARLHQRFNLGWVLRQPDLERARAEVDAIRLLSIREMQRLFPDASIEFERVGPLIKSLMAVRWSGCGGRANDAQVVGRDCPR
jgi:hypothetical protein